ncbi:MAG TPA: hypothetical protein VFT29_12025 [Gemmatimonadaceae bacterium]|nr:hypothetical protein [Gemmatimonadaceae bacterium]
MLETLAGSNSRTHRLIRAALYTAALVFASACEGVGGSRTFGLAQVEPLPPASGDRLVFVVPPSNVVQNTVMIPAVVVAVQNVNGDLVVPSTAVITLQITPTTGTPGAVLSGVTSRIAVNGIATFPDLSINLIGGQFSLTATSPGIAPAISLGFAVLSPTTIPTP